MVQGWIDAGGTDPDDMAMKPPITLPSSTVSRNALVLIAVVAAGAAVYWLRGILTPLAMAIFLMIMIDGLKRGIETRTPVPGRWAGVAALLLVVLGAFDREGGFKKMVEYTTPVFWSFMLLFTFLSFFFCEPAAASGKLLDTWPTRLQISDWLYRIVTNMASSVIQTATGGQLYIHISTVYISLLFLSPLSISFFQYI